MSEINEQVKENEEKAGKKEKPKKSLLRNTVEWILTIVVAVVLAFGIRTFVFEMVRVDGASMNDTLQDGEVMVVSKLDYATGYLPFVGYFKIGGDPQRFDVVICHYPDRQSKGLFGIVSDTNFVKRVVGLPGDTIQLINGYLYVNGEKYEEYYISDEYRTGYLSNFAAYTVPEGEYFVMGDHRNNSNDSRSIGPITREMIVGKVVQVVYPFNSFRSIPNGLDVKAAN